MDLKERMDVFLEGFEKEPPKELKELGEKAVRDRIPILSGQAWTLLNFVIRLAEPKRILEIGTAVGYSALLMRDAAPSDCLITTIEKDPERIAEAKANFSQYAKEEDFRLLEGDAEETLERLLEAGEEFDLVFLDAAKGQYGKLLHYIERLMVDKAVLIADNAFVDGDVFESRYAVERRDRTIHSRMREFLHDLKDNPGWDLMVLPVADGVVVANRIKGGHDGAGSEAGALDSGK